MESIKFEYINQWGVITLQKRATLNALDFNMILNIRAFLEASLSDSGVLGTLIKSGVSKVFSAGGDVKAIYDWYIKNDYESPKNFIQNEYNLNAYIHAYSKPIVAIMDGLTLGGGVGLSRYANYRFATPNAVVGMPEVKIAFFPDVGAGYFLNLLPHSIARFLALTGYLLKDGDLLTTGYATHLVGEEDISSLVDKLLLRNPNNLESLLSESITPSSKLSDLASVIDCFNTNSLVECIEALKQCTHLGAEKLYQEMLTYSPLALHIIWRYMDKTRGLAYPSVMQIDTQLATQMFDHSDIFEGIRTRLINKNDLPKWRHNSIYDVSNVEIDRFFD